MHKLQSIRASELESTLLRLMEKGILFLTQDHERAFFDSADWALGKVGHLLHVETNSPPS